jgi:hypothetical protein
MEFVTVSTLRAILHFLLKTSKKFGTINSDYNMCNMFYSFSSKPTLKNYRLENFKHGRY